VSPEIREAIEDACDSQVAITGYDYGQKRKPIDPARAADLIRRFAQNVPSEMTMSELCDELCHANNQGSGEGVA
jgi:hypothetical protein